MTFGEGLDVTNTLGVKESKGYLTVRTVGSTTTRNLDTEKNKYSGDSTIIIKSGRFEDVSAFAHNGAKADLDGTCRVYLGKGTSLYAEMQSSPQRTARYT